MNNSLDIWNQLLTQKTAALAEIGKSSSDNVKLRRLTEWIRRELDLEVKHKGLITEAERLIAEQQNSGMEGAVEKSTILSDLEAAWTFQELSKQERAQVARHSYLNRQKEIGNFCERVKGKTIYRRKADGIVFGLTFSIGNKSGKSWFLGLPKNNLFEEAVLLCQSGPRSVKIIHLPKESCEKYVRHLSVNGGQRIFNISCEGNKWFMEIPKPIGVVEVTSHVVSGELVCSRYDDDEFI